MAELNLFYLDRLKEIIADKQKQYSDPYNRFDIDRYIYGFESHRLLYQLFTKLIQIKN